MANIKSIIGREILDSRGIPTVEVKVTLDDGSVATDSAPAGTSIGKYEAVELRDQDPQRFKGMGVLRAVENINNPISQKLVGIPARPQLEIDKALIAIDGTADKSKMGANAILAVSEAVCRAGAVTKRVPLYLHVADLYGLKIGELKMPVPIFNLINGGKHGTGNLDFQEFPIIPNQDKGYSESLRVADEIYHALRDVLARHGAIHSVGDEGGYTPNLFTNSDALEVLAEAVKEAGYELGSSVYMGLDVAASTFYQDGKYKIKDKTMPMDTEELVTYYGELNKNYPLFSLEDAFFEDDLHGWQEIVKTLPGTMIVGDDLLATNKNRVSEMMEKKACNAILVKPNQIGTVAETIEVIKIARGAGWKIIVSHRSGETNDDFIADFAVGVGADYVKFGAPARGERVAKYNRLLAIEEELKAFLTKPTPPIEPTNNSRKV
jgi:enolase